MTFSQNQLFDPIEGCRDIVCPEGFTASTETCTLLNQQLQPIIDPDTINCAKTALYPEKYEDLDNSSVFSEER